MSLLQKGSLSIGISLLAMTTLCPERVSAQQSGVIQREIAIVDVPLPALSAARTISGSEITYAKAEIREDGPLIYELGGQNQQGYEFEVDVTAVGEVVEVEEEIDSSAVPSPVMRSIDKWIPGFQSTSFWRSTRPNAVFYEVVGSSSDSLELHLEISPDAKSFIINVQD